MRLHLAAILVITITLAQAADPAGTPLPNGWMLRTGVNPLAEAKATLDAQGLFTIEGGGYLTHSVRGTVVPALPARMTAAFVYRAFPGDFVLTARRIRMERGSSHPNATSGVAAIGNLTGRDTPVAYAGAHLDADGATPVWFCMVRRGDRIGIYEGPDGLRWQASGKGAEIAGTVYAGLYTESWHESPGASQAQFDSVSLDEQPRFGYDTTWLANELEGGRQNTVNSSMIGLGVTPDGTCITTGMHGEQENCMGRYREGKALMTSHSAEVGDSGHAIVLLPNGQGLVCKKNRLARFDWDKKNSQQSLSSPIGTDAREDSIRGLAVFEDEVFVAQRPDNCIVVLDLATLKPKRSLPFTRPDALAVDAKGLLWAIESGWVSGHAAAYPYAKPFRVLALDRRSGKQLGELTGVELPVALHADAKAPSGARLLVADNGRDQQVKLYDVGTGKPRLIGTLGAPGGVFAGTPGEMQPGKLNGLSSIGTDAAGNIYTCGNGYLYRVAIPHAMPNISELKCFAPDQIDQPLPTVRWSLHCTGFNIMGASWDAQTGDVYVGGIARYAYDAQRGLGREWQLAGTTFNQRDTWDGEAFLRTFQSAPDIRRLDGQRFLFLGSEGDGRVYRLDPHGNLGTLVRAYSANPRRLKDHAEAAKKGAADQNSYEALRARFPENPPQLTLNRDGQATDWTGWDWVDGRGGPLDGRMQREEYRDLSKSLGNLEADTTWIDAKGGIWFCNPLKTSIWHQRYLGLKDGIPQYDDVLKTYPLPAPFVSAKFVNYDPERDVMVVGGSTQESLCEAVRYTEWSKTPQGGARILFYPPTTTYSAGGEGGWQRPGLLDVPVAWAVAGDVLYAANRTGAVRAYDLIKGNLIEWMVPGPEVFGTGGFFESAIAGVRAFPTGDGGHLVLRESNDTIRILAHRWKPAACDDGRLPPAPEPWARSGDGKISLMWGGRTYRTGTVKGYQVYRSNTKTGPFRKVSGLVERPTFSEAVADGTGAWYQVATVNLRGEGQPSAPLYIAAAAPTARRLQGVGRVGTNGFDQTTRGNWPGVYGAEGVYLCGDRVDPDRDHLKMRRFQAGQVVSPQPSHDAGVTDQAGSDLMQSQLAPGKWCKDGYPWRESQWGPVRFLVAITDGKPRQVAFELSQHNHRFRFTEIDTGQLVGEEIVSFEKNQPRQGYAAFRITGSVRIEIFHHDGDTRIRGMFIDPAPGPTTYPQR